MRTVAIWHGTTNTAAQLICEHGSRRVAALDIVRNTAAEFGEDPDSVIDILAQWGRFVVIQEDRNESLWFASTREAAIRWAQRAPEARWEALWAIWCIRENRTDWWAPWADPAAAGWHATQLKSEQPAILQACVPIDRLQNSLQGNLTLQERDPFVESIEEGSAPQVSVSHPVPPEWITKWESIERRISTTAAAGLLGMRLEELEKKIRGGDLPVPNESDHLAEEPYWTESEIQAIRHTIQPH